MILERALRERLEAAAREHERSVGGEVRHLLRRYLLEAERDDTKEARP